jgi:hypothetical protein
MSSMQCVEEWFVIVVINFIKPWVVWIRGVPRWSQESYHEHCHSDLEDVNKNRMILSALDFRWVVLRCSLLFWDTLPQVFWMGEVNQCNLPVIFDDKVVYLNIQVSQSILIMKDIDCSDDLMAKIDSSLIRKLYISLIRFDESIK